MTHSIDNHVISSNLIDCTSFLTTNTLNVDIDDKTMPLYDDIDSFKEIVFQNDTEEDFTEGKRLTSLVRESYLKHVRQLLTQNYQVWSDALNNQVTVEEKKCLSPSDIEKCVQFLEQRALRSCMIASLYQKSMISLISSIKQKTKETVLFETFNRIDSLNLFSSDKNIQTDQTNEKISIGCQTTNVVTMNEKRCKTTSLLDLPLPDPKDVLLSLGSDFIDKNNPISNTNLSRSTVKEAVTKVAPHPVKPVCRVVAKRPSCSDDFPSEAKRRKPSTDLDSRCSTNIVPEKDHLTSVPEAKRRKPSTDTDSRCSTNILSRKNHPKEVIDDFDLICMLTDGNKISNNEHDIKKDNVIDVVSDLISLGHKTDMDFPVIRKAVTNQIPQNDKTKSDDNILSLDERLIEMGILINEDSNSSSLNSKAAIKSPLNYVKCHRNSWAMEMTAHYCNFAKIFLSLSDSRKTKLIQRFSDLFGPDDEDNCIELTEQHLSVCRKRTANMVVAGLTPYFASKRIASRLLFKEFAKRVTNSILSRTYIADSRAVTHFITEYFCEHNSVESIEDIDFE